MRDLLLRGTLTYGEFLGAEEGMATNVLADRLSWLIRQGIVTRSRDGRNVVYSPTRKGLDLLPIMLEMVLWSARYDSDTAAPAAFVRRIAMDRAAVIRDLIERTTYRLARLPSTRWRRSSAP